MITIHPRPGQSMADLASVLFSLADGDPAAVTSTSTGMTVPDALGLIYLAIRAASPPPVGELAPAPVHAAAVTTPMPDSIAALAAGTETRGGLNRPVPAIKPPTPPRSRMRSGPLTRTEEPVHHG